MTTLPRLMWKFIVPLFALALLVGCSPAEQVKPVTPPTPSVSSTPTMKGFDGKMLTGKFIVVLSTSEGDITVENVTWVNSTTLRFGVSIGSLAISGFRNLTVTTPDKGVSPAAAA
ncbi:MAG: hypothetical protein Greene041662_1063, partial [Candidatus Peregrinibacteria bacterium Greene0416_62]